MDINEYNKYLRHFYYQHNQGKEWYWGNKLFAMAYRYHDGDWQKTLGLAADLLTAYNLGAK